MVLEALAIRATQHLEKQTLHTTIVEVLHDVQNP
jgi:hypothetical protein